MKKPVYYLSMAAIASAIILLWYFIFMLFYPYKPAEVLTTPIPVLNENNIVKVGTPLLLDVNYCRYENTPAMVSRELINHQTIVLQDSISNLPLGCHTMILSSTIIPDYTPPGEYVLHLSMSYHINPLRIVTVDYETEKFIVVR